MTVTADNATVVTFAKQSGAGTVTGTGTATAASGVATKTITGALVGECGLRARGDGGGVQWFFALRAEPVQIVSEVSDPLLGSSRHTRKIFPALSLVDWSAG